MTLGDPDTAGAPPKPAAKPADATNYEAELQYLQQQLSQEPRGVYTVSENRAKYLDHPALQGDEGHQKP